MERASSMDQILTVAVAAVIVTIIYLGRITERPNRMR
jgi:hypothetical protein